MLRDTVFWTKIGRIIVRVAERFNITSEEALDLFYESETCTRLHDPDSGLYLYGDLYIVDELVREIQNR